jgi:hypothetical protein
VQRGDVVVMGRKVVAGRGGIGRIAGLEEAMQHWYSAPSGVELQVVAGWLYFILIG